MSAAVSDVASESGAASLDRHSAASLQRLNSRPALHPLVSSASSSSSIARVLNVSNHPSESNATENQQGMGPNQLVDTALAQEINSDVARSVLIQQNQRQQELHRLQELAMAQTMQQVNANPGILNSLSQRDLRTSVDASDLSGNGATSLDRYLAAPPQRLNSRPALNPLDSSASSSTSTTRVSNVSNHPSESNATVNQQGMMGPNPLVNTTSNIARPVLFQQNQRQQELQRFQELAMAQTMQQVHDNPGILSSLSQLSIPPVSASYPPALPPPQALLASQMIQQILANPGLLASLSQVGSFPPAAVSSYPPAIHQLAALPPPPLPVASLSPGELLIRLQYQQQLDLILASDRQTLMGAAAATAVSKYKCCFTNCSRCSRLSDCSNVTVIKHADSTSCSRPVHAS